MASSGGAARLKDGTNWEWGWYGDHFIITEEPPRKGKGMQQIVIPERVAVQMGFDAPPSARGEALEVKP